MARRLDDSARIAVAFGKVVRAERHRRGISQEQLGFEAGIHRTYVGLIERGTKNPTLNTLFALASALKVRPSSLIRSLEQNV